jgi:hypothetical protein
MLPGMGSRESARARVTVRERFTAQLLAGEPARDAVGVVERLLAVQAQDPRGFRLAIRARTRGLHSRDVEAALADRALVVATLNRGTLHLVRREDYPWLRALLAPTLRRTSDTRLGQEDITPAKLRRALTLLERRLADGPATRIELAQLLERDGIPTKGAALLHVFFRAAIDGLAVRGPMLGKQHAYVLVREWLGAQPQVEREWALRELARRYLSGHGPASDRDLARWAGLPLRDVRAGFAQLDLVERDGLLDLPGKPPPAQLPPPRLLGAFDPLLHGWIDRSAIIASAHTRRVLDGGMFWPFALARGRAVARWKLEKNRVALDPFEPVGAGERAALERDAADVVRYLG